MALIFHPAQPDYEALAKLVADLPGGEYIGDKWRTEPKTLIVVDFDYGSHELLNAATNAYPAHQLPGYTASPSGFDSGAILLCVPKTVAKMLVKDLEPPSFDTEPVDCTEFGDNDLDVVAQMLVQLWNPNGVESIGDAVERWLEATYEASLEGVDQALVLQTAATIWADGAHLTDFDQIVQAAITLNSDR